MNNVSSTLDVLLNHLKKIFNLPIVLLFVVIVSIFFVDTLDITLKQFFYSISLTIKDFLVFFVPFIILSFISSSIIQLRQKASWIIILALICVLFSNFLSTIIAYCVSLWTLASYNYISINSFAVNDTLKPLWICEFPKLFPGEYALYAGILWGFSGAYFKNSIFCRVSMILTKVVSFSMYRIFIPLVPFFVAGFILKLGHEGLLVSLSKEYTPVFFTIFITQITYIIFLYALAAKFRFSKFLFFGKNSFPSVIMAFCTMSSTATIPVTLEGAEKNTKNIVLSRMLVPTTASIHLIGDSISIPMSCIAIMFSFGCEFPSVSQYIIFALHFTLAKFFMAAVPGGGIVIMVPIIEAYLGFSPEMSALASAFYIFFDPMSTAVNTAGNGVFAILLSKMNEMIKSSAFWAFLNSKSISSLITER